MGLFRKGKTHIVAKFLRTDLDICSHSREGETPSYSRINTVIKVAFEMILTLVEFANSVEPDKMPFGLHCLPSNL